jgi:hypothetical protein
MTRKQADNLMVDLRKSLRPRDYCEDVYLSTKNGKSKCFKSCSYFETETWLFIWTLSDSFVFNKKEVGDFIFVASTETVLNLKKEDTTTCNQQDL